MDRLKRFANELTYKFPDSIKLLAVVGSHKGIDEPESSDIDLFVIVKEGTNLRKFRRTVFDLEEKIYGISHSPFTYFIESYWLATNDSRGIHLVLFEDWQVTEKGLKLHFPTNMFLSSTLLIDSLQKEGLVLYGSTEMFDFDGLDPDHNDNLKAVIFPLILIFLSCFLIYDRNLFIPWVLKCLKIHLEMIEDIERLDGVKFTNINKDDKNYIKKYRYLPMRYTGTRLKVLGYVLKVVLSNVPSLLTNSSKLIFAVDR